MIWRLLGTFGLLCGQGCRLYTLVQWFSTFPVLGPFNRVPLVVVTRSCNVIFATVMNYNVNNTGGSYLPLQAQRVCLAGTLSHRLK